jgi:adenylate cyclase class 2
MHLEVEQKYRIDSHTATRRHLGRLGARADAPVIQIDTYYGHPQRDFACTDEALRIRREGQSNWLTYKGPKLDQTTKTRQEINLAIEGGERGAAAGSELLLALGFVHVAEVRKQRQSFQLVRGAWTVEVSLDEIRDLGRFAELEILADESDREAACQQLAQVAEELGLTQVERTSYLELLLQSG